jgi:glycosyltransferase involved in cell wall biosynthesis
MNVLYVVFKALLGGHVLSATTIAREMRRQGINPVFAGGEGAMAGRISQETPFEPVDIPLVHGLRETYFTWASLRAVKQLRAIIREKGIDLVHAFDARSYMHCYLAALLEGVPVTCTLCGGVDPFYNLPRAPRIMVFSGEQKTKMVERYGWPAERVELIRTRLDVSGILEGKDELSTQDLVKFGIDQSQPKIMMISSFDSSKIAAIHQVLGASEILHRMGESFQLVLIGGKGKLHEEALGLAGDINRRAGKELIVFTGQMVGAYRLLKHATVVMGVGRSAFEGMAFGHPTVIVGENGFAGIMEADKVETLGYYNFSGRNQTVPRGPEELAGFLASLMKNSELRKDLGDFAREFVKKEIDVRGGIERIEAVYRQMGSQRLLFGNAGDVISFLKCLVPVAMDNTYHTLKRAVYAVRGKRLSISADIEKAP